MMHKYNKYMNIQLSQLERMNKEIEVRHNRTININIRNGWLRSQTLKNYQSEYDRVRNHMSNSATNSTGEWITRDKLNNRKGALEKLGAQAFHVMRN